MSDPSANGHSCMVLNISHEDKTSSLDDNGTVFSIKDIYDVNKIVLAQEVFGYTNETFETRINEENKKIRLSLEAEYESKMEEYLSQRKFELTCEYAQKINKIIDSVKQVLMQQFSVTDEYALKTILNKCAAAFDNERPEFVFVSKNNFDIISRRLSSDKIEVLGLQLPIGIGHNLRDDQVMIEGRSTVLVSDLNAIIDNYFPPQV